MSGTLIGAVNTLVDITDRKSAEEAAGRLAAIIQSSADAIMSEDLNGVITSWNSCAKRVFGYTDEEIVGKPVALLSPTGQHDEETSILERLRRGERVYHYETIHRHKNGSLVEISLSVSPIKNTRGKVVGASKIARDITHRRTADETARRLAAIVESSDDAIVSKDLNGNIITWNPGAQRLFGYTAEEVIGKPVTILIPPDRYDEEPGSPGRMPGSGAEYRAR